MMIPPGLIVVDGNPRQTWSDDDIVMVELGPGHDDPPEGMESVEGDGEEEEK